MASETFQSVKLPAALFAELGATPADFADKLAAFFADSKATKLSLSNAEAAATVSASAGVDLEARLASVEKAVADFKLVDAAAILAEATKAAKLEASSVASAILAKSGGAPLTTSGQTPDEAATAPADSKAKWAADAKLQSEFPSAEAYAGFCKLEAAGRVRISSNVK